MGVACNKKVYRDADENMAKGLTRLTAVRKKIDRITGKKTPDAAFHFALLDNQRRYLEDHGDFILGLRTSYEHYFNEYTGIDTEAEEHHDDTHNKKQLRDRKSVV